MATSAHCPACSDPVGENARFCASCGAVLDVSSAPTGTAPRPRTPARRRAARTGRPRAASRHAQPHPRGRRGRGRRPLRAGHRCCSTATAWSSCSASGGMGEVYRAEDLVLGQSVALKFLPAASQDDPERLERFYNEARMAREVTHPAVCRVHDVGQVDGQTVPVHGIRGRRGPGLAAAPHRPPAARQGPRDRAAALRGRGRRPRQGRPPPRPEAAERDARRPGQACA